MAKLLQGELFENAWSPIRTECSKKEAYEEFVAKFDTSAAKTTDDCYTPQEVYNAVLNWVHERCDIAKRPIVRPFYPGGDYVKETYPMNCVVVDNPPFSILSQIVRFFLAHNIDFFLFAPALTLFSTARKADISYIVTDTSVVYANGAKVSTAFVTNLFPGKRVIIAKTLKDAIANAQQKESCSLPIHELPPNVITAARLNKIVDAGDWAIPATEAHSVAKIDNMKQGLFGSGFLISDSQAAQAAKVAKVAKARIFELSSKERAIVEKLNNSSK